MIDNEIGNFFPPAVKSIGYVFMLIGILLLFVSPIIGLVMALAGTIVAFLKSGVQIDKTSNRVRDYSGLFNFKTGSWETMDGFSDIAVLRKRISTTAFSRANRPATTSDEVVFDICLMDNSHRRKRVIERLTDMDAASTRASQLGEMLQFNYGPYNPEISAATQARRK